MNERPIIMSGESVRAILDGRKSQTRRVIDFRKLQAPGMTISDVHNSMTEACQAQDGSWLFWYSKSADHAEFTKKHYKGGGFTCPYGVPGDRLWVKEAWAARKGGQQPADGSWLWIEGRSEPPDIIYYLATDDIQPSKWRSPLFMPRSASRLTLEILNVRVERVQDISEKDITAEGISGAYCWPVENGKHYPHYFAYLWDSLNAKRGYSWDANPWVWVIEFRRVEP
jgi:hypothetical protein